MIRLMAQLCGMCAMLGLVQMILPEGKGSGGMQTIGGMLMLHLTLSGLQKLCAQLAASPDIGTMWEILIR